MTTALYAHNDTDIPGRIHLAGTNDAAIVREARKFVANGYRNGTWVSVLLPVSGRSYICRNYQGLPEGSYTPPLNYPAPTKGTK